MVRLSSGLQECTSWLGSTDDKRAKPKATRTITMVLDTCFLLHKLAPTRKLSTVLGKFAMAMLAKDRD